ncbi:MAG TPA: arsenate reductase [Xanthomonadaceae bacterium]|nr:arsenate reductase [Xanthomonadaceae bacterium]
MSLPITLHGLSNCGTCKKARAWLDTRKLPYRFTDYRAHPVPPARLKAWATQIPWEKLVNRSSPTWRKLPEARKNPVEDADWLALIAEFPALVRRPVVTFRGQVSVGFSDKRFAEMFGA